MMTASQWAKIKHFEQPEFDSPDSLGSGKNMMFPFLQTLDELRDKCAIPFIITSGYRTHAHNKEVGGVFSSAHVHGWAADIAIISSSQRHTILSNIFQWNLPINRIGIASRFLHLDMDPSLPSHVIWTY